MQISEEEKSLEGIPFSEAIKRPNKKPAGTFLGSEFTLMKPHLTWEKLNSDFIEAIKNEPEPSKKHELFLEMEKFVDLLGEGRFQSLVNLVEENEKCFDEAYRNWFDENFGEDI